MREKSEIHEAMNTVEKLSEKRPPSSSGGTSMLLIRE